MLIKRLFLEVLRPPQALGYRLDATNLQYLRPHKLMVYKAIPPYKALFGELSLISNAHPVQLTLIRRLCVSAPLPLPSGRICQSLIAVYAIPYFAVIAFLSFEISRELLKPV